jgi:hypothetical protein
MRSAELIFAVPLALPCALDLFVLSWRRELAGLDALRAKLAVWGMVLSTIGSLPAPLLLWNFPDYQRRAPFPNLSIWGYLFGIGLTVAALPCIAFGRGRFRWVGLASTIVSLIMLGLVMLADGLSSAQM